MTTIYDTAAREQLLSRLDRLTPTTQARWGKMTAPAMVSHLLQSFRFAAGELTLTPWPVPLRPLVRWLGLYVLPFPKGAPAPRGLLARVPESWEADFAALRAAIAGFTAPPSGPPRLHPVFGTLSGRDLGVLAHKHVDHHLRQFGC